MEFLEEKLKGLKKIIDETRYIADYRSLEDVRSYLEKQALDGWISRRIETFNKHYNSLRDEGIPLKEATEMLTKEVVEKHLRVLKEKIQFGDI